MKLLFRGADREVTGSKHILEVNGKKILLDCGLFQGDEKLEVERNTNFGFNPREIDMMVLSHAHMDHAGLIPRLVKDGFSGPIYTTKATKDLMPLMLGDSAHIQEREAEYTNKKRQNRGETEMKEPLYTQEDVEQALPLFQACPFDQAITLSEGVEVTFHQAGHILGSAMLKFRIEDQEDGHIKSFVFSGDLGRRYMPLLEDPYQITEADYVLMESTYGDRVHESLFEAETHLVEVILNTISRGGKVLIPAFSLGRTQDVVYSIHHLMNEGKIPKEIKVYVDSPLSVGVTAVFREHLADLDEETQKNFIEKGEDPFNLPNIHYTASVEESKAINNHQGPCIVITSSGMIEHGRILHHLRNMIEDHRNTLVVVGYQAQNTLGRKLLDGHKEVKLFGELFKVRMDIERLGAYSAHADRSDLLEFLSKIKGLKKVMLVHGEEESALAFKKAVEANRFAEEVLVPFLGEEITL